jgi:hypothetical protein
MEESSNDLTSLFKKCIDYGTAVRSKTLQMANTEDKVNGLELWQQVKTILNNSEGEIPMCESEWTISRHWEIVNEIITAINTQVSKENETLKITTSDLDEIYNYVRFTLEIRGEGDDIGDIKRDNDDENDENDPWKRNHFFLQTIRIPKNNPCTLLRICQIGYNLGQLSKHLDEFSEEAKKFYTDNNLQDISSYIDITKCGSENYSEIIQEIDKFIIELNRTTTQSGGNIKEKYMKYKNKYLNLKYLNLKY